MNEIAGTANNDNPDPKALRILPDPCEDVTSTNKVILAWRFVNIRAENIQFDGPVSAYDLGL